MLADQSRPVPECVVIGIPTFGMVSVYWTMQLLGLFQGGKPMNRAIEMQPVKGHRVDEARNMIVEYALSKPECSHVFFLDDDVIIPPHTLITLLAHERPIVSGLYFGKSDAPQPLLLGAPGTGPKTDWTPGDVVECYGHGMGCTLIDTEVFRVVESPWFKTTEGDEGTQTEDLYFLEKAAEHGYTGCVDTGILGLHYDATTDRGFPVRQWEQYRANQPVEWAEVAA